LIGIHPNIFISTGLKILVDSGGDDGGVRLWLAQNFEDGESDRLVGVRDGSGED
jgi:hypothetical protein